MQKKYWIGATVLLVINGLGGLAGGWSLMKDPTGKAIGFAMDMPDYSPFQDFLIPGIALFSLIGLSSILIAVATFYRLKHFPWLIFFQGLALAIFLSVEVTLGFFFPILHITFYALSILLMVFGFLLIPVHRQA